MFDSIDSIGCLRLILSPSRLWRDTEYQKLWVSYQLYTCLVEHYPIRLSSWTSNTWNFDDSWKDSISRQIAPLSWTKSGRNAVSFTSQCTWPRHQLQRYQHTKISHTSPYLKDVLLGLQACRQQHSNACTLLACAWSVGSPSVAKSKQAAQFAAAWSFSCKRFVHQLDLGASYRHITRWFPYGRITLSIIPAL